MFYELDAKCLSIQLQVTNFVNGLFETHHDLASFKNHLRDFLVQSKEFSTQDNKDLYSKEAAALREAERQLLSIPGLIAPSELQEEMIDTRTCKYAFMNLGKKTGMISVINPTTYQVLQLLPVVLQIQLFETRLRVQVQTALVKYPVF